jgi:WD40 repeat protein
MTYIIIDPEFGETCRAGMKAKNRSLLKACSLDPTRRRSIRIHDAAMTSIIFIDELRLLVTGADNGRVKTVSIESMSIEKIFEGHQSDVIGRSTHGSLKLSWSSSHRLIISSYQKKVMIWNPCSMQVIHTFQNFVSLVVDITVSERLGKVLDQLNVDYG